LGWLAPLIIVPFEMIKGLLFALVGI
ncbi:hypothetical protein MNBD_GAMMA04-2033, partial [hydrothermal vent metagenome]